MSQYWNRIFSFCKLLIMPNKFSLSPENFIAIGCWDKHWKSRQKSCAHMPCFCRPSHILIIYVHQILLPCMQAPGAVIQQQLVIQWNLSILVTFGATFLDHIKHVAVLYTNGSYIWTEVCRGRVSRKPLLKLSIASKAQARVLLFPWAKSSTHIASC